jgi:luciferase family oxidoreductase group 1
MGVGYFDLGKHLTDVRVTDRLVTTIEFAQRAERRDVARYWVAEHHGPGVALSAPEVALGMIAARTSTLRLGPAGVLLRYYQPFKVLETYLMLTQAFGPRFDLGVCRGPGVASNDVADRLVGCSGLELTDASFEGKASELVGLIRDPPSEPLTAPSPFGAPPPDPWILGSGPASAALALKLDAPYGFMCFYPSRAESGPKMLASYQAGSGRRGLIAVAAMCADTDRQARAIEAQSMSDGCYPSNVVGSPRSCLAQLGELAERYRTSDMVLASFSPRARDHVAVIELAAEANHDARLIAQDPDRAGGRDEDAAVCPDRRGQIAGEPARRGEA